MNKTRRFVALLCLGVALSIAGLGAESGRLLRAEAAPSPLARGIVARRTPLVAEPRIPPPVCEVTATLSGGPATFCPGWNIWYTLRLRNTGTFPVTNLVITDPLPEGAYNATLGPGNQLPGVYDPSTRTMTWRAELLDPGQEVVVALVARTYTSLAQGQQVRNTFTYMGFNLPQPGTSTFVHTVDRSLCEAGTPSPTVTPEPTQVGNSPTVPARYAVKLPLIAR
jgi:uncharacterized repeat protein (TIGR01451 family)